MADLREHPVREVNGVAVTAVEDYESDAMRAAGLGNVSYPLLVSSCIVGFFLYSLIFLREKVRPIQFLGLALCIGGIAAICVKSAA